MHLLCRGHVVPFDIIHQRAPRLRTLSCLPPCRLHTCPTCTHAILALCNTAKQWMNHMVICEASYALGFTMVTPACTQSCAHTQGLQEPGKTRTTVQPSITCSSYHFPCFVLQLCLRHPPRNRNKATETATACSAVQNSSGAPQAFLHPSIIHKGTERTRLSRQHPPQHVVLQALNGHVFLGNIASGIQALQVSKQMLTLATPPAACDATGTGRVCLFRQHRHSRGGGHERLCQRGEHCGTQGHQGGHPHPAGAGEQGAQHQHGSGAG